MDITNKSYYNSELKLGFKLGEALRNGDADAFFNAYDKHIPADFSQQTVNTIKDIARDISDLPTDQFENLQNNVYSADIEESTSDSSCSGLSLVNTRRTDSRETGTQCTYVGTSQTRNDSLHASSVQSYKSVNQASLCDSAVCADTMSDYEDEERPGAHDYYYQRGVVNQNVTNAITARNNDAVFDASEPVEHSDSSIASDMENDEISESLSRLEKGENPRNVDDCVSFSPLHSSGNNSYHKTYMSNLLTGSDMYNRGATEMTTMKHSRESDRSSDYDENGNRSGYEHYRNSYGRPTYAEYRTNSDLNYNGRYGSSTKSLQTSPLSTSSMYPGESNNVSGNSESSSALDKRKKRRKNKPVAKLLPKVGDVYGDKGDQSVEELMMFINNGKEEPENGKKGLHEGQKPTKNKKNKGKNTMPAVLPLAPSAGHPTSQGPQLGDVMVSTSVSTDDDSGISSVDVSVEKPDIPPQERLLDNKRSSQSVIDQISEEIAGYSQATQQLLATVTPVSPVTPLVEPAFIEVRKKKKPLTASTSNNNIRSNVVTSMGNAYGSRYPLRGSASSVNKLTSSHANSSSFDHSSNHQHGRDFSLVPSSFPTLPPRDHQRRNSTGNVDLDGLMNTQESSATSSISGDSNSGSASYAKILSTQNAANDQSDQSSIAESTSSSSTTNIDQCVNDHIEQNGIMSDVPNDIEKISEKMIPESSVNVKKAAGNVYIKKPTENNTKRITNSDSLVKTPDFSMDDFPIMVESKLAPTNIVTTVNNKTIMSYSESMTNAKTVEDSGKTVPISGVDKTVDKTVNKPGVKKPVLTNGDINSAYKSHPDKARGSVKPNSDKVVKEVANVGNDKVINVKSSHASKMSSSTLTTPEGVSSNSIKGAKDYSGPVNSRTTSAAATTVSHCMDMPVFSVTSKNDSRSSYTFCSPALSDTVSTLTTQKAHCDSIKTNAHNQHKNIAGPPGFNVPTNKKTLPVVFYDKRFAHPPEKMEFSFGMDVDVGCANPLHNPSVPTVAEITQPDDSAVADVISPTGSQVDKPAIVSSTVSSASSVSTVSTHTSVESSVNNTVKLSTTNKPSTKTVPPKNGLVTAPSVRKQSSRTASESMAFVDTSIIEVSSIDLPSTRYCQTPYDRRTDPNFQSGNFKHDQAAKFLHQAWRQVLDISKHQPEKVFYYQTPTSST